MWHPLRCDLRHGKEFVNRPSKAIMKYLSLIKVAAIALILIGTQASTIIDNPENKGITFFDGSYAEALKIAKEQDKLVFLDAYASWCGPCKILKRGVFTKEEVGSYFNENFINLEIDMEKGEGPEIARKYRVRAYPTLLFLKSDGSVVKKAVGYRNAEQLLQEAKQANEV